MIARHGSGTVFEKIILDNNQIGDEGAEALAEAVASGAVKCLSLRSCSVRAQGSASFARAMVSLLSRAQKDAEHFHINLDLSGNPLGTQKIKKKKGAMYSANLFREKASTNIKFIGKTLKGAAKRFGAETMGISVESDDDEEIMGGLIDEELEEEEAANGELLQACGGMSFATEILRSDLDSSSQKKNVVNLPHVSIGMRQCCLGDGAIDALAALVVAAKGWDISIDVSMNSIEDDIVDALKRADRDSKILVSRAQCHTNFLNRIAEARQRQVDTAAAMGLRDQEIGGSLFDDDDCFYDAGSGSDDVY